VNKKRLSIVLAIFLLAQVISLPQNLGAEIQALNPPSRISEPFFQQISAALSFAISLYERDVLGPASRYEIKKELQKYNNGDVCFDLDNMIRKGLICYYHFSVSGENFTKNFIIRIFPTAKSVDKPDVDILYEMTVSNPPVTCQVLPGVNDILKDVVIKPHRVYDNKEVARSS